MNGGDAARPAAAADQRPVLQRELDEIEASVAMLHGRLAEIDSHLDGLTNRPPRAVEELSGRRDGTVQPVPGTVEGRMHLISARLVALFERSEDVMKRLHAAF